MDSVRLGDLDGAAHDSTTFPAIPLAAGFAVVLPTLIAFNVAPSATLLNQAAALIGWMVLVSLWAMANRTSPPLRGAAVALAGTLGRGSDP